MSDRDEFEAWVRETYGDAADVAESGGIYTCPFTMALFTGWKAARRWRPIETVPENHREVIAAIAVGVDVGSHKYTTDPWTVLPGKCLAFPRWPHPFPPTHWTPLPEPPNE